MAPQKFTNFIVFTSGILNGHSDNYNNQNENNTWIISAVLEDDLLSQKYLQKNNYR